MLRKLQSEYSRLLDSMDLRADKIDMSLITTNIEHLESIPFLMGSAVSMYDNFNRRHVYESEYHKELFSDESGHYNGVLIHPEDTPQLFKNAIATLRHIFNKCMNLQDYKFVREYRAMIHGTYRRVTEDMQIVGMDEDGKPWITLSIVNVSPNQAAPFSVNSHLINLRTGDVFVAPDEFYDKDCVLTPREIEILKKISEGLLSKEIADCMKISVHTVNTHRQRILSKLKVNNSIEAIKYASVLGLSV